MEETAPEARTRAELRGRRLSWISELLAIPRFDETVQSNYHPWYMVGMFHFRRAPRLADIRSDTFPRIARFPRFAMVLREGERNEYVTEPVDPASMDATYHVRALQQERPWTQDDLNDYVGSLGDSLQLENSRPLWQLRLVERLEGGGAVLICVLDHTIGDGAYAMTALLSATDAVDGLPAVRKQTMTAPPRRRMQRKLGAAEWLGVQGTGLATVFAPGLVSDGPSPLKPPFNLPPSARKHVSTSRPIALDAVRTLRQAVRLPGLPERAGSLTVHDVIVAATAVALHECIADAGVERYTPRIGYTFSLRPPGFDALSDARGSVTLGHKCALPSAAVARGPAAGVLRHMKLEHDRSKQSIDGFLFDGLGERMFPAMKGLRMHSTMLHLLHQDGEDHMLRLSNLPGPQQPIRLAGELVDSIYVLPICYYGIFVTATSYNGLITLTAAVDDGCHPSARQLAERWAPAFDQLFEEVVGAPPPAVAASPTGSMLAHADAQHSAPKGYAVGADSPGRCGCLPRTGGQRQIERLAPTTRSISSHQQQ